MTRKTIAILFAVTTALALAACSGGDDGGGGASAGSGGGDALVERGAAESVEGGGVAPSKDAATPIAQTGSLPGAGPRIIQTAAVRLVVKRNGFDQAVEEARAIAGGLGGFVVSSSESRDPGAKTTTGTLTLRVPQTAYATAMGRLGDLGKVAGREESGQDVSAEFVDLESRKRHLEAVETQLLKLLQRADDVPAALAVQAKLDDVQRQLEEVRGRLRYLDDQTAFATINLALREQAPVAVPGGGGILEAWGDGARAFANVAGDIFVGLATVAPVLVLLALLGLALRVAVRRGLLPRRSDSAERDSAPAQTG
jgi:Domain of unknown function (DUF4349)